MNLQLPDTIIYYRLTAMWVFCEAFLGGIIHGFHVPVSGLVIGSMACFIICMIAWYTPGKTNILKAMVIVAVFKMLLSPQSPPMAYVAVFFQGFAGQLLVRKKNYVVSCLVFTVISLLESAIQRIFVLTVIYSNGFWNVLNDFFNRLFQNKIQHNYILFAAILYLFVHLATGFIIGMIAVRLPQKIIRKKEQPAVPIEEEQLLVTGNLKKRMRFRFLFYVIWVTCILFLVVPLFGFSAGWPLKTQVATIILRSILILLTWKLWISPFIKKHLHHWLLKKKTVAAKEVEAVMQILPWAKTAMLQSWRYGKNILFFRRIPAFFKQLMLHVLYTR
jgi:hypothetical protein